MKRGPEMSEVMRNDGDDGETENGIGENDREYEARLNNDGDGEACEGRPSGDGTN